MESCQIGLINVVFEVDLLNKCSQTLNEIKRKFGVRMLYHFSKCLVNWSMPCGNRAGTYCSWFLESGHHNLLRAFCLLSILNSQFLGNNTKEQTNVTYHATESDSQFPVPSFMIYDFSKENKRKPENSFQCFAFLHLIKLNARSYW